MELVEFIVFAPLIAAIFAYIAKPYLGDRGAQAITTITVLVAAILAWLLFLNTLPSPGLEIVHIARWGAVGDFTFNWALRVDSLSIVMMLVVTSVSAMVHIYSIGYMSHDTSIPRFMAYLSLFTFFMLMLVTADNLVQLFFGWEGVGLASYLLIGFWHHKDSANQAAIKAFLVNRVGDIGFALGIFAIYIIFGSVEFSKIFANTAALSQETFVFFGYQLHAFTVIAILLFIGAMGKSAQLGLHTWLPDAMEGPTPVSALIHAATMVTAGVFMLCRLSPLLEYAPTALMVVTIIGASTAFFAGTVAIAQTDIKRVIAYSTCSQLGYMFFAIGVSAYPAAMFHLTTHAFFKALLFLGAGSVIHNIHHEQDMRHMGGLRTLMPLTYMFMLIGSLSLMGVPFFAGYYSKDLILESAFAAHTSFGYYAFWLGIAAAFTTAFYSTRLLLMSFHGQPRLNRNILLKTHEAPMIMLLPLAVLAIGAIFSGIWFYDIMVGKTFYTFWGDAIYIAPHHHAFAEAHHVSEAVKKLPIVMAAMGAILGIICYQFLPALPNITAQIAKPVYSFLLNKWYFDELYDAIFVKPALKIGQILWRADKNVIDKIGPDGVSKEVKSLSQFASWLQSGFIYHYAFAMLIGIVLLAGLVSLLVNF
ncbi:MAG: NADH-quinone oxidoreductase subunit L [Alphaproteobacteria bacterium]|nr:NADH-quinone oxidoreductase subunit L [Alphaproteobacteria bacterium]